MRLTKGGRITQAAAQHAVTKWYAGRGINRDWRWRTWCALANRPALRRNLRWRVHHNPAGQSAPLRFRQAGDTAEQALGATAFPARGFVVLPGLLAWCNGSFVHVPHKIKSECQPGRSQGRAHGGGGQTAHALGRGTPEGVTEGAGARAGRAAQSRARPARSAARRQAATRQDRGT